MTKNLDGNGSILKAVRLGIDTSQEAVIYMRHDCHICRSEGFTAHTRVEARNGKHSIIATTNVVMSELVAQGEAGLSETAWNHLQLSDGDTISVHHTLPLESLGEVRSKVYGNRLSASSFEAIIGDITRDRFSDIYLSAFITACAGENLDFDEIVALTQAMIGSGDHVDWGRTPIVDKHCVGGLPGNRTTPIVVAIIAAHGLTIPKTSSRSITSPAGTVDTMETMAPVELNLAAVRQVVEREGGCIVWGGSMRLSPADEKLIRVERALDLDCEGQLVASVLSKKAAAGSTHLVLDIPMGPSAKVRTQGRAEKLGDLLVKVAATVGMETRVLITDGSQPVGRGIGPALEAFDVMAVLENKPNAPTDLRERSLRLAGEIIELVSDGPSGEGYNIAKLILSQGRAWKKFLAICEAQGGFRQPPTSDYQQPVVSDHQGTVHSIDNRLLARAAKLSGAPYSPAAGITVHSPVGTMVDKGEPLFTIHAESPGELNYAMEFISARPPIFDIGEAQ
jgi:thymidine phosphorylase